MPDAQAPHRNSSMALLRIGIISDTHGLVRPEALAYLKGCDAIIHAGDVCDPDVLLSLSALAPLTVVRGNNDWREWADQYAETALVQFGGHWFYVIHDLMQLEIDPRTAGVSVVVSGHTHAPSVSKEDGVLFINPGSAGPRRLSLPISIGEVWITPDGCKGKTAVLNAK